MQLKLPVQPEGAEEINGIVAVLRRDGQEAYFASGVPLFTHREDDLAGRRVVAAQLMELGLAKQGELSAALGVNRTTLFRQHRKLQDEGVSGVVDQKRGPKGAHRFTAEKRQRIEQLLGEGESIRRAAKSVGVSEGIVRYALGRGELGFASQPAAAKPLLGPQARSRRDAQAPGGVAVQRHAERALARMGQLGEAAPQFVAAEAVRYGGALLALPALLMQGLLDAGEQTYGTLKKGFYGLRATLLVLAFMALLRIRTPEQLQGHPPGELGVLLGLDRAPEVKTLRRKLWELAMRKQATSFSRRLAERWVAENRDQVGLLYVDGHVRPYHGTKHRLPKGFVTRRRLCMPATMDFWVNQQDAQPLFVVTAPGNDDMISMLREHILPEVRSLVGTRRVTLVFDREGYSPKFFQELARQNFDMISYRRGNYPEWPVEEFETVTGTVGGKKVSYNLAERSVEMFKDYSMREIRRRCDNGHQTAILTTRDDAIELVAYRMFERWTQENFFRYMRQHFALDALVTYDAEPADGERLVPNPQRKEITKARALIRNEINKLTQLYGERSLTPTRQMSKRIRRMSQGELVERIRNLKAENQSLRAQFKLLSKQVPVQQVVNAADLVKLEPETKHLTDAIKMIAYRAETAMVRSLGPHFTRTEEEGRALIREMLLSNADVVPQPEQQRLLVRVHSLSNPRSNAALADVCQTLNALEVVYPGTNLTMVYQPPDVA